MVATLPEIDALRQNVSVTAFALHPNSEKLLIGSVDGTVQCLHLNDLPNEVVFELQLDSKILDIGWTAEGIVILDEINGLHAYTSEGDASWSAKLEAGGAKLMIGDHIMVLDGIGTLRRYALDGRETESKQHDVRSFEAISDGVVLVMENQTVVRTNNQFEIEFQRPQRGEIGEDIVAIGSGKGNQWYVAREGHALVPGEEEALEIELYEGDNLLSREEIKGRVKASISDDSSHYLGLDNGELISMREGIPESLHRFSYPIQCIDRSGDTLLIGTWFYIYGLNVQSNEIVWQIEHKGMVEGVQSDAAGRFVFFGDDQNDWTGAEPVGVCSLNQQTVDVDESFLQLWFEEDVVEVETNPEVVYRNVDDYTGLLSEDEQQSLQEDGSGLDVSLDSLADAMNEELNPNSVNADDESIDDLFHQLQQDADQLIPPKAYAGENQTISTNGERTAVVVLDGTLSSDPQERIKSWSWLDSTGLEISTDSKLKVKLSPGIHQFELRIFDVDGGMTTDSIQITIVSSGS